MRTLCDIVGTALFDSLQKHDQIGRCNALNTTFTDHGENVGRKPPFDTWTRCTELYPVEG